MKEKELAEMSISELLQVIEECEEEFENGTDSEWTQELMQEAKEYLEYNGYFEP